MSEIKQRRGRQLGVLTRLRRQVTVLIETRSSRTKLVETIPELDKALSKLEELNDEYMATVTSAEEQKEAEDYFKVAERQQQEAVNSIQAYLKERRDEPPSIASSLRSKMSSASHQAEIAAQVKTLEVEQLERRLKMEKQEQDMKRQRQLQEARDAKAAAELEAHLQRAAENELSWERKDDFVGESALQVPSGMERPAISVAAAVPQPDQDFVRHPAFQGPAAAISGVAAVPQPDEDPVRHPAPQGPAADPQTGQPCCRADLFSRSLPRLSLPKFDGNPAEWVNWFALFRTLVHEQPKLTPTEKMAHLQAAVSGLAQTTIEGMLYRGELYEEAVNVLKTGLVEKLTSSIPT